MVNFTILAGGYEVFVATYIFNSVASTLTLQSKSPTGPNPSWITVDPQNKGILYAVNEVNDGALQSFALTPSGVLSHELGRTPTGGALPAFAVALSTGSVAVMNYNTGNGRIVPRSADNGTFDGSAPVIKFGDARVSHPHQAVEWRGEVLVPDLGMDTIWRVAERGGGKGGKGGKGKGEYEVVGQIPQPKGSGPRHIVVFNDRLFTLHELSSTLSVSTLPAAPNGTVNVFSTVSVAPPEPASDTLWAAAEILIPPPTKAFPIPYIYVSNRNKGTPGPRGDSIAIFEHVNKGRKDERLRLVRQVYTGLGQIRGMEVGKARSGRGGERWLVAAASEGKGGVHVYERVDQGRDLRLVAVNTEVPTRTGFVWLDAVDA